MSNLSPLIIKETFLLPKNAEGGSSGDAIFISDHFIAVIDGATPKGNRLWNGMRGDAYVAGLLKDAFSDLPSDICAAAAIECLNDCIRAEYERHHLCGEELPPEERLQASIVIYSAAQKEIWSFGDCQYRVGGKNYTFTRKGDALFADLRAFVLSAAKAEGISSEKDLGREAILPFLRQYLRFANTDTEFGYDVINGTVIHTDRVHITPVNVGDLVILASDGYPLLFDTLAESESYLAKALKEDPDCIGVLRSTKGLAKGNVSYDDRSFVSFIV
jgi:hypothetical protein